jgi:L-ribulose-5-phosphate 4-epimerase
MKLQALREAVVKANLELVERGLVMYTWGNVSGIDRETGIVAIKPSGVSYDELDAASIVLIDLEGQQVDGDLRPSSDTPTHLELYRAFPGIGGVAHTHSRYATLWAQSHRPVPCLGTTHADHFFGTIPVTRMLKAEEVKNDYEASTGKLIVETFTGIDAHNIPAVLVAGHGPFTWGEDAMDAATNSGVLEFVTEMAYGTIAANPGVSPIPDYLLNKHFLRKHGADAYYGQQQKSEE